MAVEEHLPVPSLAFNILLALSAGEKHGYAVLKDIEQRTVGRSRPSTGSLYATLVKLQDRGLIRETARPADERDARRRYYRVTQLGADVASAEARRLEDLVAIARDRHVLDEPSASERGSV